MFSRSGPRGISVPFAVQPTPATAIPFYQNDWPNPLGYLPGVVSNRAATIEVQSSAPSVLNSIKPVGQPSNIGWGDNPKGYSPGVVTNKYINSGVQSALTLPPSANDTSILRNPLITKYEKRSYHVALRSQADQVGINNLPLPPPVVLALLPNDIASPVLRKDSYSVAIRAQTEQVNTGTLLPQPNVITPALYPLDWLVPIGYTPSISLRTWVVNGVLLYSTPLRQLDWPNPKGPLQFNRSYEFSVNLNLIGKDQTFGLGGYPTFDWPNPKGYRNDVGYKSQAEQVNTNTLLSTPSAAPSPFYQNNWPVPKGQYYYQKDFYPEPRTLAPPGVLPPRQTDWPNPRGYTRNPVYAPQNLVNTTLAPVAPLSTDWRWNDLDSGPNIITSDIITGHLATYVGVSGGGIDDSSIRTNNSVGAIKGYFEASSNIWQPHNAIGMGNASAGLGFNATGYAGSDTNSIGFYSPSFIAYNGANILTWNGFQNANDVIGVAFDNTSNPTKWWFRLNPTGIWNNDALANPATGVGGIAANISGPLFPMATFSEPNDTITANFGKSTFAGVIPAGFTSLEPFTTDTVHILRDPLFTKYEKKSQLNTAIVSQPFVDTISVLNSIKPFYQNDWPVPKGTYYYQKPFEEFKVSIALFPILPRPFVAANWANPVLRPYDVITNKTHSIQNTLITLLPAVIPVLYRLPTMFKSWKMDSRVAENTTPLQNTITILTAAVPQVPARPIEWPNPVISKDALTYRSFIYSQNIFLIGQDVFYGDPGQVPGFEFPQPRDGHELAKKRLAEFIKSSDFSLLTSPNIKPFRSFTWPDRLYSRPFNERTLAVNLLQTTLNFTPNLINFSAKAWNWQAQAAVLNLINVPVPTKSWVWLGQGTENKLTLSTQKSWIWNKQTFGGNFTISSIVKAWNWTTNTFSLPRTIQFVSKSWQWRGNPATLIGTGIVSSIRKLLMLLGVGQ